MSKSKLGRKKKDELLGMLKARGITADGRKQQLVDLIWEYDNQQGGAEQETEIGVSNQAATLRAERPAVKEDAEQVVVRRLRDEIEELNKHLENVKLELAANASEHDRDRAYVNQLVKDLEMVKSLWASNLQDIGERMEAAVRLQVSQEEVAQLRETQEELQERMSQQQRLLAARDEEVRSLAATLEQLRMDAAQAERLRKEEHSALLTLAGQATAGGPPVAARSTRASVPAAWSSAGWGPAPAKAQFSVSFLPSEPLAASAEPGRPQEVFSMALPGLAAVYVAGLIGNGVLTSYLTLRNAMVTGVSDRYLADVAVAVALAASVTAALS